MSVTQTQGLAQKTNPKKRSEQTCPKPLKKLCEHPDPPGPIKVHTPSRRRSEEAGLKRAFGITKHQENRNTSSSSSSSRSSSSSSSAKRRAEP